jgi:1-acyl-sn-glycerol-3-phosphate acyltransferase
VIPIAHWGTQDILPYGSKKVKLFPRKTVRTVAGKPVDLSEWAGKHTSARALRAATEAIMGEVTALVAELRAQEPPALAWDPNTSSRTAAGSTPPARPAVAADPVVTPEPAITPDTAVAPNEAEPEVTGQ